MARASATPAISSVSAEPEQCSTCKFTLVLPDGARCCRRFPPSAQPLDSNSGLPFVKDSWWCGEYKRST